MKNKNADLRFKTIEICLQQTGRYWAWNDIFNKVNAALSGADESTISRAQMFRDLNHLISTGSIEKIKEGRNSYYSLIKATSAFVKTPLNYEEASKVKSALEILTKFRGLPQFEWLNEMIPVLKSKMGLSETTENVISFESNIDYSGNLNITPLFNAVVNRRVLGIKYQNFKRDIPEEIVFHPYHLRQYNSRWFAFGHNPKWPDAIQNLALDRIKEIKEIRDTYELKQINWDEYFDDFIGVSKHDGELIEIKLLILDAEQAAYIETKPLHPSQKKPIRKVANGFETSIKVMPNYELEKLILSFGERVQVISPESLRERIKERVNNASQLYE